MGSLKGYYRIKVHDKDGELLYDSGVRPSKSFVIQFLELLFANLAYTSINITNIAGTEDAWTATTTAQAKAPSGETEAGILVGSGTTTPTNEDFKLATQIMHGTGSGQLQHGDQAHTQPSVAAGYVVLVCTRSFLNASGATVTVREIGYAAGEGTSTPTTTTGRLLIRDVLPSPVDVANGATLTVEYIMRTTV